MTPTCPACGSKFSHDKIAMQCSKCGLPDEIRLEGPRAIARWKRKPTRREIKVEGSVGTVVMIGNDQSKAERRRERQRKAHPASANRRRNKHGRSNART